MPNGYILARFLGTFIDAKMSPDGICPYTGEQCDNQYCCVRCQRSVLGRDSVSLMTWRQWIQYLLTGPRPEPLGRWWARGERPLHGRLPRPKKA